MRGRIQMPSHKELVEAYQFGFSAPGKIEFKVDDAAVSFALKSELKVCTPVLDGRFPIEHDADRVQSNSLGRSWVIAGGLIHRYSLARQRVFLERISPMGERSTLVRACTASLCPLALSLEH